MSTRTGSETVVPTRGRVQARQARTRERLLRAAYLLMSKQGVDATTIQQITEEADVGFGTFYNYFESKDDIAGQVLDCVIHNLGLRNDLANAAESVEDPMQVVANSVRLVAREMRSNAVWHWWVKRPDFLVERMRAGFRPFGIRDLESAIKAGSCRPADGDPEAAWSALIWLLAGGIKDMVDGHNRSLSINRIADNVMRVMGLTLKRARAVSTLPLPSYPDLAIDFDFIRED